MNSVTTTDPDSIDHWPAWYYHPTTGEGQIFNNPLEVPEGWHDSPAKVGDKKAKTVIPGYDEALEAELTRIQEEADAQSEASADDVDQEAIEEASSMDADDNGDDILNGGEVGDGANADAANQHAADEGVQLPEYDKISKEDIVERLKLLNANPNPVWSKQRLYDMLVESLADKD